MEKIVQHNIPSVLVTFMLSAFSAFSIANVVSQISSAFHVFISAVLVLVPLDFIGGAAEGVFLGDGLKEGAGNLFSYFQLPCFNVMSTLASVLHRISFNG
jgi:hypothetical protein